MSNKKMSFTFSNEKQSLISPFKRNKSNNNKNFNKNNKFTNKDIILEEGKLFIYYFGNLNAFNHIAKNYFYKIEDNNEIINNIENGEYKTFYFTKSKIIYEIDCLKNNLISLKKLQISQKKIINKISCGCDFTFILTKNDEVYSWGKNLNGQLGLGDYNNYSEPKLINSISNNKYNFDSENGKKKNILNDSEFIIDIACGSIHTIVCTNFNRIFSCGFGETYALGHGNNSSSNKFLEIKFFNKLELLEDKITKLVAGISHSGCLIGNKIYLWGIHINKKNFLNKIPNLFEIPEKANIVDIQLGDLLTVVLNNKGNIFVLGNNQFGQLGNENLSDFYFNFKKIKLKYPIDFFSCGANHTIAYSYDNNYLVGWGSNICGQLNPFDPNKFYSLPTELEWLKNSKPYKIICGKYSSNLILMNNLEVFNNIDKKNKDLIDIKEKYNVLKNKYSVVYDDNKNLKNEINSLNNTLKVLEKSMDNSFEKISDIDFSNDVIKMLKKELKNSKIIKPQFEIDFKEIKLEKKISEGGFGVIWKAKWRETFVAVKILKSDLIKEDTIKDFLYEIKAMESLRHPNVVMFLGQCTKLPNLCIVLEYCSRKSLWSLLQKKEIKLSWNDKKMMALEIAKGMNYLHNNNPPILHRDLKSLNILIDDGFRPKIADFGWTRIKGKDMTGKIGTFQWMAPEVIKSQPYSEKADVFSFGIMLWEFASREPPFKEIGGPEVALKVMNNNLRPTIPSNTPKKFKELMTKCWDQIPNKRPSFKKIIEELRNMTFD